MVEYNSIDIYEDEFWLYKWLDDICVYVIRCNWNLNNNYIIVMFNFIKCGYEDCNKTKCIKCIKNKTYFYDIILNLQYINFISYNENINGWLDIIKLLSTSININIYIGAYTDKYFKNIIDYCNNNSIIINYND